VTLDGCFNVRDVGGYETADGRAVQWRRLYRAGGPHAATSRDIDALRHLNVATIVDLRTADELRERGRYVEFLAPRATHHLPMLDVLPGEQDLARFADATFVADHYFEMLAIASDAIAEALSILTDPSAYPAFVHCSAGKDRTGVLVAVILGALGVDDDTIIEDYALSGPAMAAMFEFFTRSSPDARERLERNAPAILAADPDAMRGFIARLRASYGGFEGYVDSLGVASAIPHLRSALLA
jgi:protein-tyrosine phosphatase